MEKNVIQFQNKKNKDEISNQIQIEMPGEISYLTALLNTLLSKDASYLFYYKDKRIVNDLLSLNIHREVVNTIDYVDIKDLKHDSEILCDDFVIDIHSFENNIYYVLDDGSVLTNSVKIFDKIKGLFSYKILFGFSGYCVFNIIEKTELFKSESQIRSCVAFSCENQDFIGICIEKSILIYNILDNSVFAIENLNLPRSLLFNEGCIYFIESYNQVSCFNLKTKIKNSTTLKYSINNLSFITEPVVTTANNRIVILSQENTEIILYDRFQDQIKINSNKIFYSTQYSVNAIDLNTMEEAGFIKTNEKINCFEILNEKIFIGNGRFLTEYSI